MSSLIPTPSIRSAAQVQDVGGKIQHYDKIDREKHEVQYWEKEIHACLTLLMRKNVMNVDELRRGIESLSKEVYDNSSYYEKWAMSIAKIQLERKTITQKDLDEALGIKEEVHEQLFQVGDKVRVRGENLNTRWRKPHVRTPGYIYGISGIVERFCGMYKDPMQNAYLAANNLMPLYRIRFKQKEVWPEYTGHNEDTIDIEIFQNWLDFNNESDNNNNNNSNNNSKSNMELPKDSLGDSTPLRWDGNKWVEVNPSSTSICLPVNDSSKIEEEEDGHSTITRKFEIKSTHTDRQLIEKNAIKKEEEANQQHGDAPGKYQPFAAALLKAFITKGVFTTGELSKMTSRIGESFAINACAKGKTLVAKAWKDPKYRELLLNNSEKALEMIGFPPPQGIGSKLVVVENTESVHNLVVCTLCSCFPSRLLGNPPGWYKSRSYRSRSVREPRSVLKEFGIDIDNNVRIQVHDSTADMRYIVLPKIPNNMVRKIDDISMEEIESIITRDCMIGTDVPVYVENEKL